MKEIRDIKDFEREILINNRVRSRLSLGVLFYIMGLLLPLIVCMIITLDFTYLYILLAGITVLLIIILIYPMILENHIINNEIHCFESEIHSCKPGNIYNYLVEINGIDDEMIDYKYPIKEKVSIGTKVIIVMLKGRNKYRSYLLIDKNKRELLTSRKTRYDLIDC